MYIILKLNDHSVCVLILRIRKEKRLNKKKIPEEYNAACFTYTMSGEKLLLQHFFFSTLFEYFSCGTVGKIKCWGCLECDL